MGKQKALLLMFFLALLLLPQTTNSQTVDKLQALIDNAGIVTRSTDEVNEIDISDYSSTELNGTVYVRSGQKTRFVNGTLKSKAGYTGPLVTVQAGGQLELPSGVFIYGQSGQDTPEGLVKVTGGELYVKGATISLENTVDAINVLVKADETNDGSVSQQSIINITNGSFVAGSIDLSRYNDFLTIEGSKVNGIIPGSPNNYIYVGGDIASCYGKPVVYYMNQSSNLSLRLKSALQSDIRVVKPKGIESNCDELIAGYAGSYLYTLTESDLAHVSYYDENYPDKKWKLYIENNIIKVKEAPKNLQEAIDALPVDNAVHEIDLSQYENVLSKTLDIKGRKVKFINGELKPNFKGHLIHIYSDGSLEVSEGVTITTCEQTYDYEGLIYLSGGTLTVSGGQILNYRSNYPWQEMVETNANTTGKNTITVESGKIHGYINSNFGSDFITLKEGSVRGLHAWNENATILLYGEVSDFYYASGLSNKNVIPKICSNLKNDIHFQVSTASVDVDNKLAYCEAKLTLEDLQHVKFITPTQSPWSENEWTTFIDTDGYIKLKKVIKDLQEAIDALPNDDEAHELTLSQYEWEGNKSLVIKTGRKVKLVNGSLTSVEGYTGPLVTVEAGGYLDLASGVTIQGYPGQKTPEGLVKVTGGEIHITNSQIGEGTSDVSENIMVFVAESNTPTMPTKNMILVTKSRVAGRIQLSKYNDYLSFTDSRINGIIANSTNNIVIFNGDNKSCSVKPVYFRSMTSGENNHLQLITSLTGDVCVNAPLGGIESDNVLVEVYSSAHITLTESDLAHVSYYDEDNPDKKWETYIEDNKIKVKEVPKSLQETIDALPEDGDLHEIDLSKFDSEIGASIIIKNGKKVKMNSGTLTSKQGYTGALVTVQSGGYLEYSADVQGYEGQAITEGLIKVTGGELCLNGAKVRVGNSDINDNALIYASDVDNTAASTIKGSTITIKGSIVAGRISLSKYNDVLNVDNSAINGIEGNSTNNKIIVSGNNRSCNGKPIYFRSLVTGKQNVHLLLRSALDYDICINAPLSGINNDNILIEGNPGNSSVYQITDNDLTHISYYDPTLPNATWEVYLEDNIVKVKRIISQNEYNLELLQAELDKIAAEGSINTLTKPMTVTIPAEGIVIDKPLWVKKNCYALVTGGPLKIADDYDKNTTADFVWGIEEGAKIVFSNIAYDANNQYHHVSHFFVNGQLEIGEGFEISNIYKGTENAFGGFFYVEKNAVLNILSGDFDMARTVVYAFENSQTSVNGSAILRSLGENPTIDSKGEVRLGGNSRIYGGTGTAVVADNFVMACFDSETCKNNGIYCEGQAVDANKTTYEIGTVKGKTTLVKGGYVCYDMIFNTNDVTFEGTCSLQPLKYPTMPTMMLNQDALILTNGELVQNMTPAGQYEKKKVDSYCWKDIEIGRAIIKGNGNYEMTEQDFGNLEFLNLPAGIKAHFDKNDKSVKLIDLQWLIDNPIDNTGEEDKEVEIPMPCDGITTQKELTVASLQALIDGTPDETCGDPQEIEVEPACKDCSYPLTINYRPMNLSGGNFNVAAGATVRLSNIYVTSEGTQNTINVDGTLIIDRQSYMRKFKNYAIHVRPGGKVIWRGNGAAAQGFIYNEGGTIDVYEGEIGGGTSFGICNISGTVNIYPDTSGPLVYGSKKVKSASVDENENENENDNENDNGNPTRIYGGIQNGTAENGEGTLIIHGGEIFDGIVNYGTLIIKGGTIRADENNDVAITNYGEMNIESGTIDGKIYNYTDFNLNGNVSMTDVYLASGVKVKVTKQLTTSIGIHFINGFTCYQPIVTGSDTYELTYNDLQMLSIYLPYGYQWVYDSYYKAVIITVVNSIDEIFSDDGNAADIYDVKGVKVGNTRERKQLPDGLYIVNGKTIMLKQK